MRYVIIDGYNVIRADPRLLALENVSLENARNVLVQTLASAPRLAHDEVMVVFDGAHGSRSHVHAEQRGRVVILYSARGQVADDVILAEARARVRSGTVVVVSNDVELRENCRAAGAEITGSENLLNQIPGRPRRPTLPNDEWTSGPTSTQKRGNPRRSSKKARQHDVRF